MFYLAIMIGEEMPVLKSNIQKTLIDGKLVHETNIKDSCLMFLFIYLRIMPAYNYTIDISLNDDKETLIRIIMIDTTNLCGSAEEALLEQPKYRNRREKLKAKDHFDDLERQLEKLKHTYIPYVLVAGHHPVWSVGEVGPIKCNVDRLRPLLHKYNVSAYLAGHDHSLQHISDVYLGQRVEYIITGAANTVDLNSTAHENSVPPNTLKYLWHDGYYLLEGGLNVLRADRNMMNVTFFETTGHGKQLYETAIYPRKRF